MGYVQDFSLHSDFLAFPSVAWQSHEDDKTPESHSQENKL